ncbi:helix-hairpin-helix domain-containing protein [Natrinema sp. SYSU A 869]|uniref:helix-hairpin-helix domain-containing protein n=1 Tax=Natrinema sp. SYSU A 869 TaxID=2871694 RepID=UPI001CA41C6E|nr:helix-hairpin-helix domain-containing protein [Natrinema sp. SYSU A 869]
MCATFSPDDIDKTVENANGEVIGTVTEIEGGTAHVKPRSGVMDSIRAALGWERATGDTVVIREGAVGTISDDVIRLGPEPKDPETAARTDIDDAGRDSEPDVIVDRGPDSDEADEIEPSESAAAGDRNPPGDPVEERGGADELYPDDEIGGADELEETQETHPAADTDDADADTAFDEPVADDDSFEADEQREFDAPSAADEIVDTDARDGLKDTAAIDETASTDEPDAAETDEAAGANAVDESTEIGDSDERTDLEDPSRTDESGRTEIDSSDNADESGAPDEAASTVDMADERGATDGIQSTETGTTEEGRAGESQSASAGSADANEIDRTVESNSFEDVSDGLDDAEERNPAEDMGLADELDNGIDIESTAESNETAEHEETAHSRPSEEENLVDELDRGSDIESVTDDDRETDPDIDPDAISGEQTGAEAGVEMVDRRIVTEDDADIDHRPAETAGDRDRTALEDLEMEPEERKTETRASEVAASNDRSQSATPLSAMFAAQRAALEPGKQAVELQQRLARNAVSSGMALQRQQLRLAETVASTPVELAATMMGSREEPSRGRREESHAGPDRPDEGIARDHDRTVALLERHVERLEELHRQLAANPDATHRRLELVDGLDSMYRERLVDAGITSLDDLAQADSETVADAAEVTEKRAASWIEQADT